jgi:short-subunit dehydrogenase
LLHAAPQASLLVSRCVYSPPRSLLYTTRDIAGMDLVLISRTPARLAETKAELLAAASSSKRSTPVDIITIAADFSADSNDAVYETIKSQLSNLDIGVLINNVSTWM